MISDLIVGRIMLKASIPFSPGARALSKVTVSVDASTNEIGANECGLVLGVEIFFTHPTKCILV